METKQPYEAPVVEQQEQLKTITESVAPVISGADPI